MSKLIRSQRKGKSSSYSDRFIKKGIKYGSLRNFKTPIITEFVTNPKTQTLTANVSGVYIPAYKFAYIGETVKPLKLIDCELGTEICCIEMKPFTNSYACRSSGTFATVFAKTEKGVQIQIKSKGSSRKLILNNECVCLKGKIGCGEKKQKPLLKAGNAYYKFKAKGKKYPNVSAHKMNIYAHPLGGTYRKHIGLKMTRSRNLPPGAKFGSISAKRTGHKNK